MVYEEDTFDEDEYDEIYEEFDEEFPDAEEGEYEDDAPEPILPGEGRFKKLLEDPYPSLAFPIIIVGIIITLITPPDIWDIWRIYIVGAFVAMIISGAGTVMGLKVYYEASGWLRFGGPTNIAVVWGSFGISVIDLMMWMLLGTSLFGIAAPVISAGFIINVFCVYSLWLIQRTINR